MKTKWNFTLAVLSSLLLATTAYADDEVDEIDICREFSLIAKEIMTARQDDKPMSETLPIAIDRFRDWADKYGFEMDMEDAEEFAAEMVMAAYESSPSFGEEHQRRRISEFENSHFGECYKGLTSDSEE